MRILLLILFLLSNIFSKDEKINVSFIIPDFKESKFWQESLLFANKSAKDLNINLKSTFIQGYNRYTYLETIKKECKKSPDYIIALFLDRVVKNTVSILEKCNIPYFMINSQISKESENIIGEPRIKYKNYIGNFFPNEEQAGYILAKYLIKKAKKLNPNKQINVIAISGNKNTIVAYLRNKGLKKAIKEDNALLKQIVHADWNKDIAYKQAEILLKRYNKINVVWAASDAMALSVEKLIHSEKIVIGGIDWTNEGINSVKTGNIDASVGGHFTELAYSLVLLYDYHNKKDFADVKKKYLSEMKLININNLKENINFLLHEKWNKIDFKNYSRFENKTKDYYDFDLKNKEE